MWVARRQALRCSAEDCGAGVMNGVPDDWPAGIYRHALVLRGQVPSMLEMNVTAFVGCCPCSNQGAAVGGAVLLKLMLCVRSDQRSRNMVHTYIIPSSTPHPGQCAPDWGPLQNSSR